MRKKRLLLTLIITIAAVIISCSISFGSNAVVDSGGYTHPPQFSNTIVIDGVDVSVWQYDIDWEKVKRQGIDYAFIRVGYSGLDSPFSINQDRYFEQNYQKAREAGLMVGVYYYSTATSLTEAQKEAKFVLDVLNNRELDLPVVYDFELQTGGRLYKSYYNWDASSRKAKAASNSLTFLNYIEKNSGYRSMFYSYRAITSPYMNPGGNKIDMGLIEQKYPVWLAQYSSDNSYERPYEYWQYTSSGSVTGINGNTDCNFWYYNNAAEKTLSGTTSIKDASVQLSRTSYEYTKFQKRPTVTVTYGGKTLKKGTDYKVYYIKNVLAGTGYAMIRGTGSYSNTKLVPFEITKTDIADGGTANNIADKTYTGDAFKPSPKVYYKTTLLKKNVDYTISYANNTDAGTAKVTINGKRNYYGSFTKTFKINKADPTFTGYTSYSRKTDSPDWKINTKVNSGAALTYKSSDTSIASVDSEGKVTLKGKEGIVYITVTSPSNKNYNEAAKQVKITVTKPDATSASITTGAASYSKTADDGPFSLNASTNSDGAMTYASDNTSVAAVDSSGNVTLTGKEGTAVITIKTAATEKFAAASKTVKVTVTKKQDASSGIINGVKNTTITANSALGDKAITVKWTKSKGYKMDYYQVYKSASSQFASSPYFVTKNGSAASYKNTKGLTNGTKYYYRVRGARVINGTVYYSKWSNTVSTTYKNPETAAPNPNDKLIIGVENTTLKASSTAAEGSISINWLKSPGYRMDYYEVFKSLEKETGYGEVPYFVTTDGLKTNYKNTKGLVKGTRYYYKVRGVRLIDGVPYYSQWSNPAYRIAK